jgi:aa3 type cytochrome c oxidase subunit IV
MAAIEHTQRGGFCHMSVDLTGGHPDMDYEEHHRTYKGFLIATQVLVAFIAILLIGMAYFLV